MQTNDPKIENLRGSFETWHREHFQGNWLERLESGEYKMPTVNEHFEIWCGVMLRCISIVGGIASRTRPTIALLNSMVASGEQHSEQSSAAVKETLDAIFDAVSDISKSIPPDHVIVPRVPNEDMWGGLARDIMMWMDFDCRKTPRTLLDHLRRSGSKLPDWLADEPEMKNLDHVISKGTRVVLIYRAMVEDFKPLIASRKVAKRLYEADITCSDGGHLKKIIVAPDADVADEEANIAAHENTGQPAEDIDLVDKGPWDRPEDVVSLFDIADALRADRTDTSEFLLQMERKNLLAEIGSYFLRNYDQSLHDDSTKALVAELGKIEQQLKVK